MRSHPATGDAPTFLSVSTRAKLGLPGEEPEPGSSRIPGIDDCRASDEIVPGAVFPLHDNAEKPQTAEEKTERKSECPHDTPPRVESRAVRADDAHAEHRHAEGPAARRPAVTEIKELPDNENGGNDDV